jgi:tight adherence protein B
MGLRSGALLAAVTGAGLAVGLVLLVAVLRGTTGPLRQPPGRLAHPLGRLRSPGVAGRLVGGLLAGTAVLVVTRWPVAATAMTALVVFWPHLFGGTASERSQILRLEALVVWTESLRDTIAAHASLEQAIPASTSHCPPMIRPALTRLAGQIRARAPLDDALLGLAAELDDPSADLVCAALILNVRRRGDRLTDVLTGLAAAAREELDMRRRISAGRQGLRRGVQIVVLMTLAFAAFLVVFGGTYVRPYDAPAGQLTLLAVAGMFAVGFAWLTRLSAVDRADAFLARPGPVHGFDLSEARLVAALTGTRTDTAAGHAGEAPGRSPGRPRAGDRS